LRFYLFELADIAECLALRCVAYAAGVENYYIGVAVFCGDIAFGVEQPRDFFGIVDVHLAAVCDDFIACQIQPQIYDRPFGQKALRNNFYRFFCFYDKAAKDGYIYY